MVIFNFQLKSLNNNLQGDEKPAKRRRNALINALTAYLPGIELGKKTISNVVRDCLYAIAPVYLWQCFSSQGKSGTAKGSLAGDMPQLYRIIMAATINAAKTDSNTIISTIGAVIRSCPTRAESRKYRKDHPEVFPESDEDETKKKKSKTKSSDNTAHKERTNSTPKERTVMTINSANGRKRPVASDKDSEEDISLSSPESRQQPPRKARVVALSSATGLNTESDVEEIELEEVYSDDSDVDPNYRCEKP